ncbi:FKBP-type peptidyl-prolyl cis-trans isomerase [Massilia soli]|uniref:peptidylprolyl isomerase n=1 Tax=Massilia soli TaxID=2792854 RepID=A0ABS7ST62_9BURK|nr:FKBP-type peptidyl-prolyl cis-trans isomerase [Massilia soli]MBZ2209153.1 FKBP-type peptidyl-prolyl cis-trans isomerase [Massilia soli]
MTKPIKYAALSTLSLLLAACGADRGVDSQPATTASRVSASVATQTQAASAYVNLVQSVYVAYFGRPADPGGLAYFSQHLSNLGAPTNIGQLAVAYGGNSALRDVVNVFGTSAESQALYAGDNNVFIEAVYRNLFGRASDTGGKAFWVQALDEGRMTRANAAIQIMAAAQTTDRDIINNKVAVAAGFTTALNTPQRELAYSGLDANVIVRNLLGTVNLSTDLGAFQANVESTLNTMVSQLGAQGMYAGKLTASGRLFNSLVLEDGQYWGFYGSATPGALAPVAFVHGKGTSVSGSFTTGELKDFGPNPAVQGTLTASYAPMSSLNGTISIAASTLPFTGAGIAESIYRYNAPASIAEIQGSQRMDGPMGHHIMRVNADGTFSATTAMCSYTGKFSPRATGKNVFDVVWSFGAGTCALQGQSATGIAFSYAPYDGGTRSLIVAATNAARTAGALAATPQDGLVTTDITVGTGAEVVPGGAVTVHYTGWLYSETAANKRGTQFDSSAGRTPFSVTVGAGRVIQGWDRGLLGMKAGGKRTLVIPAALGYGASGTAGIPPNATLIFDVEVVTVK